MCSNLGILSASVLSIIPLIRPYQWQSFFMPVLPNAMLDFLDAPVPFIVGVKSKTAKVQSKSGNDIYVDVNKNQGGKFDVLNVFHTSTFFEGTTARLVLQTKSP